MVAFVPDSGDIVWLDFDPQTGHEQAVHRPALVVSPALYNGKTGLMLCCPMTTQVKHYPFEVAIDEKSVALCDQVKSLDWQKRNTRRKGKASAAAMAEAKAKILALIG